MPREAARIIEVGKDDSGKLEVKNYRIVGCGLGFGNTPQEIYDRPQNYTSRELELLEFHQADKPADESGKSYTHLAVEAHYSQSRYMPLTCSLLSCGL